MNSKSFLLIQDVNSNFNIKHSWLLIQKYKNAVVGWFFELQMQETERWWWCQWLVANIGCKCCALSTGRKRPWSWLYVAIQCNSLHCTAEQCIAGNYISLNYLPVGCNTLHCTAVCTLQEITSHCTKPEIKFHWSTFNCMLQCNTMDCTGRRWISLKYTALQ